MLLISLFCLMGADVYREQGTHLHFFHASWCGPCKSMVPIVNALAKDNPNMILDVDTDKYQEWSKHCNVTGIPCFVMFVNGKEVGRIEGTTSKASLQQLLRKR